MKKVLKITALIFFMLADASIVGHAVICHHHFDDMHSGAPCEKDHCHGDFEDCLLSTIYVKFFNNNKQIVQFHSFDFDFLPCVFRLLSGQTTPQIADDVGLPFRQKPYLIACLVKYVSQSYGLRAPPVC